MTDGRISALSGVSYALPVVPVFILMSSSSVLSGMYATYYGLPLTAISIVMLVAGVFDAVTDPSIGYFSDRYHARTGSRKPFIASGAILLIPSAWYLLNPSENVTITYFLIWYLAFYLATTLFQIPHMTWGGEISQVSEEKTKVYGYRNYGVYFGSALFAAVPMLPITNGSEVTPESMRVLVGVSALLLLPALYMMLRFVPNGRHHPAQTNTTENPLSAIRAAMSNLPLLWFLTATILLTLGLAFFYGLYFMILGAYLGLGEYFVYLALFHLVVASMAINPAVSLIARAGKIKAWRLSAIVFVPTFLLWPIALLRNDYSLFVIVLFQIALAFGSAIGNVAMYSLLSDVSDYGTFKSGIDRSATSFSLYSLASKTCMAFGIAMSIGLAGLLGFDPTQEVHTQGMYWVICLCVGVIPAVLSLVAVVCISKITITSRRHAAIRKQLERRNRSITRVSICESS